MHLISTYWYYMEKCCRIVPWGPIKYKLFIILLIFQLIQNIQSEETKIHTNEFAVHIKGGENVAKEIAQKYGFVHKGQIGSLKNYYLFEHRKIQKRSLSPSLEHCKILESDSSVLWFEQQEVKRRVKRSISRKSFLTFHDPLYPEQWFLHDGGYGGYDMNVIPAWKDGFSGKGVVVSILDDGIQGNHPDLAQNYDKDASYDINDADEDPTPQDDDENKHGTRCAGEVAAVANNEFCGVGIAYNSSIGGVRMLDGSVTDNIEATALSLNPDHIHIYSASWGPEDDGKTVDGPGKLAKTAFIEGITKGRGGLGSIFVWASGNGGRHNDNCNCDGYTNSIYTISISSATQSGLMPWYLEQCSSTLATTYSSGTSNRDQNIITVDVDYSYFTELQSGQTPDASKLCTKSHTGTSASAPIAAAICALALEANPRLTWRDMQYLIVMTSRYEPLAKETGWITNGIGKRVSTKFGYGLMDAAAMVKLARSKEWKTQPEQHICTTQPDNVERLIPATRGERLETTINTTGCKNTENAVLYLEHVQVIISLNFHPRGNLHITLISPSGTQSAILLPRPHDKIDGSFNNWPFMSVHFWGEIPQGNWKLVITNDGNISPSGPGKLISWHLVFYGTQIRPFYLNSLKESEISPVSELEHAFLVRGVNRHSENLLNECASKNKFQITINGQSECTYKCPLGQYGEVRDYTCHMCDKSCSSCYGPSYNNCLSCPKHFLSNSTCVKSCPDGFFHDTEKRQCYPCLPVCSECESRDVCSACKHGFFLHNRMCISSCPPRTFAEKRVCKNCHHSCASCYGPLSSNCLSCSTPLNLRNSSCYTECPPHHYSNSDSLCVRCHRSCENCMSSDTCSSCESDWERNSHEICVYNARCTNGWYNSHLESCEACYPYCEQCSGPNTQDCVYCDSRYLWLEGRCVETCPDGYFNMNDECYLCDRQCSKCESNENCLRCKDGFFLHLGKCYKSCPFGFYSDGRNECRSCHSECLHCSGSSNFNCTACAEGYVLIHHTCKSRCLDGFFLVTNGEENHCLPCYSTCKTCTDFGPTHCTSCYENSTFSGSSCIPCLDDEFFNKESKECERCHDNCGRCFGPEETNCLSCPALLRLDEVKHMCFPCCDGSVLKKSECCTCSKDLDVCISSDHPRSITVNLSSQNFNEVIIPLSHVVPVVIAICLSVVLLYVILFGLLQANSMGWFRLKFGEQKYERVPNNMAAKFDAEMEKISLTHDDLEDEDDIYEKV
ncbi:furin-like isoform X1 [Argiope bruennichi]|uniref:furin-like isoform X1 n=1 Tax=Argiope bruennichi TaxID=94029 RepID=UPI0024956CE8|nr:furin-like isoform X1 [Argiope bruennichi]